MVILLFGVLKVVSENMIVDLQRMLDEISIESKLVPAPEEVINKHAEHFANVLLKYGYKNLGANTKIARYLARYFMDIDEKYEILKTTSHEAREQLIVEKINFLLMINKKLEEVGYRFYLN